MTSALAVLALTATLAQSPAPAAPAPPAPVTPAPVIPAAPATPATPAQPAPGVDARARAAERQARAMARAQAAAQRGDERAARDRRRIPAGWVDATEPFNRTFPVSGAATLIVSNVSGRIDVTPGEGNRIQVDAVKRAWGPNAEQARQWLAGASIAASASSNRVEIRVEHAERKFPRGVDVEFTIRVPADTIVDLNSVSGGVRVANLKGEVRVQAVSGDLVVEGAGRLAAAKTVSGDITLASVNADAQLSVTTVSGDVNAKGLAARAIDLNTISGDVRLDGWSGDRAFVRTLSGDLHIQATLVKGGRYEFESHSGDFVLVVGDRPGFALEVRTFSGDIQVDLPVKTEGPTRESRGRTPREVRGTYGDGSSSLRVQTFSGDVTVRR